MTFRLKKCFHTGLVFILSAGFLLPAAFADEIYLTNGDIISGHIHERSQNAVMIDSPVLGSLEISKSHIERIIQNGRAAQAQAKRVEKMQKEKEKEARKKDGIEWKREASVGYNKTSGNTDTEEFHGELFLNRRRPKVDEYTLRAQSFISSEADKQNARRHKASARYAFSFGKDKKWYNFYKVEGEHDRFANIDARVIPTTGIGYWLYDREKLKLMTELGGGVEYTNYRDETENETNLVLVPRLYFEAKVWRDVLLKEDLRLYPSLTGGSVRIVSESSLDAPLSDHLKLRLSVIDEYDSDPAEESEKNDIRLMSSLVYAFND